MGIRGLTTFIQTRSHQCMENYELHDTNLVIDGNGVACQLYRYHTRSNDCFGGDYDMFGNTVKKFFQLLDRCNITPLVIFDGGYETKKVATVISRMKNTIKSADSLNCVQNRSMSVFPLFLRPVFLEVIMKMGIRTVRCDFEGDTEIANIARILDCPVLSYDSDFFIFDVLYIPFPTIEMAVKKGKKKNGAPLYTYIPCQVYRVENFLNNFPGLEKSVLPILAVLLGNDYVKRGVFTKFYRNLKIQKCNGNMNLGQKRIKSLLIWLQNENINTAISKVLSRYKKRRRRIIRHKINIAISGYNCTESEYLKHLGLTAPKRDVESNMKNIELLSDDDDGDTDDENCNEISNSDDDDSNSDSEKLDSVDEESELDSEPEDTIADEIKISAKKSIAVAPIFLEKFRKCEYPSSFMDILVRNKYYCIPQIEDSALENTHLMNFNILSAVHKILTNSKNNLICFGRVGNTRVGKKNVPMCHLNLPSLEEIQTMNIDTRKELFFEILDIQENLKRTIDLFPEEWRLYIITIVYLKKKSSDITWPLICSLLISKCVLSYVDDKLGIHRNAKTFLKKYSTSSKICNDEIQDPKNSIKESLDTLSYADCISSMTVLIPYFTMDEKTSTNSKSFDRTLVHMISQFQSCLFHIGQLNSLLNLPFPAVLVSKCLNCTFVYNMTRNLSRRTNLNDYLELLLKSSPSFQHSFQLMINILRQTIPDDFCADRPKKRRRKKKKSEVELVKENVYISLDTDEEFFDPSNMFANLSLS